MSAANVKGMLYFANPMEVRRAVLKGRLEAFENDCHLPAGEGGGQFGPKEACGGGGGEGGSSGAGSEGTAAYFRAKYPHLSEKDVEYLEKSYYGSHREAKRAKYLKGVETAQKTMEGLDPSRRADYFPDGKPIPGSAEWREAHGISAEAAADRPYYRFPKGGDFSDLPAEVQDMYNDPDPVMQGAKRQLLKIMKQDGGLIMSRSTVPGTKYSSIPIPPQVRPDQAIINDNRELKKRENGVRRAEAADVLARSHTIENGGAIRVQEGRVAKAAAAVEEAKTMTKEKYLAPLQERSVEATRVLEEVKTARKASRKAKDGEFPPGAGDEDLAVAQREAHTAKSNLDRGSSNAARLFAHGDEEYQKTAGVNAERALGWAQEKLGKYKDEPYGAIAAEREMAAEHLEKARDQLDAVPAKYLFPPVPEDLKSSVAAGRVLSSSARVEAHGAENLRRLTETKGRVYLAMEGNLKSDAVLSAIKREGDPEAAVISVPSVTLWRHSEMQAVAEAHLRGREVVLIPDADGDTNVNVRNEARALQALLINSGVSNVKIAAPPMDKIEKSDVKAGDLRNELGEYVHPREFTLPSGIGEKAKGADDWLATPAASSLGGTLGGMIAQRREIPKVIGENELSPRQFSDLMSTGKHGGPEFVLHATEGKTPIPTKAVPLAKKAMTGLLTLVGEPKPGVGSVAVVNVTRLGSTMGKFYDDGDQAGMSLGHLEKAGLITREHIYDANELLRGRRVITMKPERIAELVKAGVIQRPDEDRPVDVGTRESPIITIHSTAHAVDLPRIPLSDVSRSVATPEGAAYYGVAIGTVLTPDIISKAILRAGS